MACSGATTATVVNSQLSALSSTTTLVSITVGGNDVGVADVRSVFVGHQLCSYGEKWLHGLNYLNLTVSYHPTAAGRSGGYYPVFRSVAG